MSFRVFISHSTADMALVYELQHWLQANGIEAYVAQIYAQPGIPLSQKVSDAILASDCVLVLWTKDGARSAWVNQEIGIAKGQGRLVIPIVERSVDLQGGLLGLEYVPYDPSNPEETIRRAVEVLHRMKIDKGARQSATATVLLVLGLLAVAAASSRAEEYPARR